MTVQMPDPISLDMPPGDADAIAGLARGIGSAARCLASIDVRIAGPAVDLPGWLGDDASTAAAQLIALDTQVRAAYDAVTPAAERLVAHAERLLEARSRVRALKHEQDEHFRRAWHRWSGLPDLQAQLMIGGAEVRSIVADVEAGEASRRRRHTALLEEIEDDAAATARVLVDSCAAVGGRGRPGEANRVVAYLAAELPGWGDRELMRLGRTLAERLKNGAAVEKGNDLARDAAALAGRPAFATAFLADLGTDGVPWLLRFLGNGMFGADSPMAALLAAAFGAAVPGRGGDDPVARVLDAEYVHPEDDFETTADVATGLAMVLASGEAMPSGGVGTRTVAAWGRQFLLWERQQHDRIGTRSATWAPEVGDPTGLAISILAERADPSVSAALLDDTKIWQAALGRLYDDGGAALGQVIAHSGQEPGGRGDRVLRMGLATAGAGLAGDDPSTWTVNRDTLAGVASGLGEAVSAHIDVAVGALKVGVDGHLMRSQADVLAGLGYVTLDRGAAAAIEQALTGWAQIRPEPLAGTGPQAPVQAAAVLGAYMAVQEFGQRTDHAMDALEDRAEAETKKEWWDHSVALVPETLPGGWGLGGGLAVDYGAILLHNDGTWADRPDRGLVFHRADAAALAARTLGPQGVADERAAIRQARAAYDRTAAVLPAREAPLSPKADFTAPVADLGTDFFGERLGHGHGKGVPRIHLPR